MGVAEMFPELLKSLITSLLLLFEYFIENPFNSEPSFGK